ncbi:hypothetical protein TIFTF001_036414 [Ficus carica]|uniref:Uncharacterized protein n=1 Tax=Ficus carica TaxID=3494 RepID=A0AA88JCQ4_FICCA|nr:hypothetical protein TIFTF001_036414 [Ficus carica]
MRDMQAEFGMSFNYLRAWRGKEAALTSLRGDDAESYNALKAKFGGMLLEACGHDANGCIFPLAFANLVYPDAAFGICVQHLAANLKTRYKDFKGPLKTYFDDASRSYLLSEHHRHMESICSRNPDMHRYLVQADPIKWSRAYFNGRRWFVERREEALKITPKLAPKAEKFVCTNFSLGLTVMPRPTDQFEYAVTSNDGQIWIVDMSEMTFHPIGSAEGWDVPEEVISQIVNHPNTKRGPGRPRVRRILSQGEEHEPIRYGRCNGYGHNRQTCTNLVPLQVHPTTRSQQSFTTPSS